MKTLALCASILFVVACGGSSTQTDDTKPEKPTQVDSPPTDETGQVKDTETPPGMAMMGMFGQSTTAAADVTDADLNEGKQLFEQFVESVSQMVAAMDGADCKGVAGALDAWRVKAVPVLMEKFKVIDAYVTSMTAEQKAAMEKKMRPIGEKLVSAITKCMEDPDFKPAMQRLQEDMMKVAAKHQPNTPDKDTDKPPVPETAPVEE